MIEALIALLADTEDSPAVRTRLFSRSSASSASRSASSSPIDRPIAPAPRAAATDPDRKLRERVLEILALQGDEYASD